MEKWLFYERQGEVSCTPAASIKSAPSPSGYEKNIFSRASAVKRRCQDRSRVARTPGICVFNGPILGGYIGRAINPPGKWIRYAHVDRLGWSMQRTGHGDLRRMITEDAARFGGTWDAIECESVKWLLDFLEIRLVKRGYKFTDYESRHEISRCFFNEYRLPLIGKIISEATNVNPQEIRSKESQLFVVASLRNFIYDRCYSLVVEKSIREWINCNETTAMSISNDRL